jgi:hypothetical protein
MINNLVGSRTIVPLLSRNCRATSTTLKPSGKSGVTGQELPESLVAHDGFTTKVAAETELDLGPGFQRGVAPIRCGRLTCVYAEQAQATGWVQSCLHEGIWRHTRWF